MIRFFSENKFELPHKRETKKRLTLLLSNEGYKAGDINYIFCSDAYLLEINTLHLQHDYYTDIITFNYSELPTINSDIYISTDRVFENAQSLNIPFETELMRVMIHGLLHLCGYKDKTPDEQLQMRAKEEYYLHLQA